MHGISGAIWYRKQIVTLNRRSRKKSPPAGGLLGDITIYGSIILFIVDGGKHPVRCIIPVSDTSTKQGDWILFFGENTPEREAE